MAKAKAKTHKGLAKRFRLTGSGKVLHAKKGKSHFQRRKSSARKRRINIKGVLSGTFAKKIKKALGSYKGAKG
ncbi:MAG: 50S ribosomal protein L35 [bacterium JZ-2024 1]